MIHCNKREAKVTLALGTMKDICYVNQKGVARPFEVSLVSSKVGGGWGIV